MIPILQFDRLAPEDILNRDIQAEEDVSAAVDAVLAAVKAKGDAALKAYTKQFNGVELEDLKSAKRSWTRPGGAWTRSSSGRWSWRRKISAASMSIRSTRTLC